MEFIKDLWTFLKRKKEIVAFAADSDLIRFRRADCADGRFGHRPVHLHPVLISVRKRSGSEKNISPAAKGIAVRNTILGISAFYHDSAAAILIDGEIAAAAHEERFTRKKHDSSFPIHAVRYVLEEAGVDSRILPR